MLTARYRKVLVIVATAALAVPALSFGDSCPADVDFDGRVGISDLLLVLADWGQGSGTSDFTGVEGVPDGQVDIYDFMGVLEAWGPCP